MGKLDQISPLVTVSCLHKHLEAENLVILDASVPPVVPGFHQVNSADNFRAIPAALRFDFDTDICAPDTDFPHMMPDKNLFTDKVQQLGINRDSVIVIYDDVGIYASPRAWWMFRAMGHQQVAVLDGGLPAWLEAGLPRVSALKTVSRRGDFQANYKPDLISNAKAVLADLTNSHSCVIDARSSGRFYGQEPEPRAGLRSGHMPGAQNLPFPQVLEQGKLKSAKELLALFSPLADGNQKLVFSCGSGLSACVLALAAEIAGYDNLSVYDGSWAEWGRAGDLPVTTDGVRSRIAHSDF